MKVTSLSIVVAIIFLLFTSLLFSCKPSVRNANDNSKSKKVDTLLNDIFKNKYPNCEDNDLVREKATKALKNMIDSILNKNVLDDIPMKIFQVRKNPHGQGAIVQFYTDSDYIDGVLSTKLNYDVIGFMSEEKAMNLSENDFSTYKVYGHNFKRADRAMAKILVSMTYYSTETEIQDSYNPNLNAGVFICEIDSISYISKK